MAPLKIKNRALHAPVQVKILQVSGDVLYLTMGSQRSVASLKVSIMNQLHVPVVCQRLLVGTTVLTDDDKLGDCSRALEVPLMVNLVIVFGVTQHETIGTIGALATDFLSGNEKAITWICMHLLDQDQAISDWASEVFTKSLLECETDVAMTAMAAARACLAGREMTPSILPVRVMLSLASANARLIDCDKRQQLPLPLHLRLVPMCHDVATQIGDEADRQMALKGLSSEILREELLQSFTSLTADAVTSRPTAFGIICFATAGLSGSMDKASEKTFVVHVIQRLLAVTPLVAGQENKRLLASWIYYILVRYPRFLFAHYDFLETMINKLREFMSSEPCLTTREMSVHYFLQVCQCCGQKLAIVQSGRHEPLIQTFLRHLQSEGPRLKNDGDYLLKMYLEALVLVVDMIEDSSLRLSCMELLLAFGDAELVHDLMGARMKTVPQV